MYPEDHEETQVIVGSMNMGYISGTARNRTHNLFRTKREPIPLAHSDGQWLVVPFELITAPGAASYKMYGEMYGSDR